VQLIASLVAALKESNQSGHVFFRLFPIVSVGLACLRRAAPRRRPIHQAARPSNRAPTPQLKGQVSVRAAVLGDEESNRFFGVSLADKGMQAVWFSVKKR